MTNEQVSSAGTDRSAEVDLASDSPENVRPKDATEPIKTPVRTEEVRTKQDLEYPPSSNSGVAPAAQVSTTPSRAGSPDKHNLAILQGTDGKRRRAVTLDIARRFGGVSRRAIDAAAHKGLLKTEGKRQQRRVLVDSLLQYFPPEK
jgi:hypothetical protein